MNNDVTLGKKTRLFDDARIYNFQEDEHSITIGDGSQVEGELIVHHCNITDNDSHEMDHLERARGVEELFQLGYRMEKGNVKSAIITIEPYVWINFNVTILKGVTIGKGAVVAAGSIVTKDVAPFTLVAGNPARFIKSLLAV
jgi:acetyltransferase-like isoleucine patch superfamily enzyme